MSLPAPSIQDLLDAASRAIQGAGDKNADLLRGSDYESLTGPCAVVWSRETQRDTDMFHAVNFNTADGNDLTNMGLARYSIPRILDTRGSGTSTIHRTTSGIAETIYAGTRILAYGGSNSKVYRVTTDTTILSGDTTKTLPIEALDPGAGSVIALSDATGNSARVDDQLKDPSWIVTAITCTDGTLLEEASVYRTRIRQTRLAARVGENAAIITACKNAGAVNVALFRSNYAGDAYDYGLNFVYVGDSGFTASPSLLKACALALESIRCEGDNLQVLPMAPATMPVTATVYLNNSPASFDLARLTTLMTAAINRYMNGSSGSFTFTRTGILGAIIVNNPEVVNVTIAAPTSDAVIVSGAMKNFPAVLNRYVVSGVTLNFLAA